VTISLIFKTVSVCSGSCDHGTLESEASHRRRAQPRGEAAWRSLVRGPVETRRERYLPRFVEFGWHGGEAAPLHVLVEALLK
jgi:hypothetical protein